MISKLSERILLKEKKSWTVHFTFWGIIFLFNLSPYLFTEISDSVRNVSGIGQRALILLFHLAAVIVASYFIALRILPLFFEKFKILQGILELVAGTYLICVLSRISVVYILEPILGGDFGRKEALPEIGFQFEILFRYYLTGIITGTIPFLLMYLLADRHQIQQKQMQIEKDKKATELAALKSQLNPHFLFNTLNNLYSLAVQQSPLTAVSIEKLSHILDYTLYRCNDTYVPLEKEIDLLNNYIALEKIRYSNRLEVQTDFHYDASYQIAPLILLSMVENMFKHGVEKTTGYAVLKIKLYAGNHLLLLVTENSYDSSGNDEQGIGLKNVQQQLRLLYPNKYNMLIEEMNNIFKVKLEIQL